MAGLEEHTPFVVTLVDHGQVGDVLQELYRIQPDEPDAYIFMTGRVATNAVSTTMSVSQPQRIEATKEDIQIGDHLAGRDNHTRVTVECDHSGVGPPSAETISTVLSHLGAAMMALKFEE